jgi:hypothetical protein
MHDDLFRAGWLKNHLNEKRKEFGALPLQVRSEAGLGRYAVEPSKEQVNRERSSNEQDGTQRG